MTHRLSQIASVVAAATAVLALAGCGDGGWQAWKPNAQSADSDAGAPGRYTILLYADGEPGHAARMRHYKQAAEQDTGWEDLRVVHKQASSELFRGTYSSTGAAQEDLKESKRYVAPAGVNVFARAIIVPLPGRHVGPPEWDLTNARGAYTVAIAVFYDVPEADYVGRKQFAVDYCTQLRQEGKEAYYYHGPSQSTVTVMAFPETAIQMVTDGSRIRPKILDPRVTEVMDEYEFLAVNGRKQKQTIINPKTGKAEWAYARSHPVHIPRKKDNP